MHHRGIETGRQSVIALFDPKYKLWSESTGEIDRDEIDDGQELQAGDGSRPVKMDIDKMHAYRDAIRDETGTRVVRYAAILYPGTTEEFGDEVAALQARPLAAGDLKGRIAQVIRGLLVEPRA